MKVEVILMYHKIGFLILIIFVCLSLLGCNRRVGKEDKADNELIKVDSEVKFKKFYNLFIFCPYLFVTIYL